MAKVRTSYKLTSSTQIRKGSGILTRVSVRTDGSHNATIKLYDTDASGSAADANMIDEITVLAANYYGGYSWSNPVGFADGLYIAVSGTGAAFSVEYKK